MKNLLKLIFLNSISLITTATLFPGLNFSGKLTDLLFTGLIFTFINLLIKPFIKLFLLPINLVTLGLFSWLSSVLVLSLLIKINTHLTVTAFTSKALNYQGFVIPSLDFSKTLSLILACFLISLIFNLTDWLVSKD